MKKFSLFLISILIGVIFSSGCGKNEKKTSLLTGTSVDSYESSPMASAVVALFKAAGTGAGAGTTSYGAPAKVGTKMQELGEADAEGKYTIIDPMGMTIKIQFKWKDDVHPVDILFYLFDALGFPCPYFWGDVIGDRYSCLAGKFCNS